MWIWMVVVCIVAYFVGVFGFSQVIGCIKYPELLSPGKGCATVILWLFILLFVTVFALLINIHFWIPLAIGYVISFIQSLNVTPD